MNTKTLLTGLFVVTLTSFSFISAQEKVKVKKEKVDAKDRSERMFKHLDINADDAITLDEFMSKRLKDESKAEQVKKQFAKIDKDENGSLDRAEFKVAFDARKQKRAANQLKKQE